MLSSYYKSMVKLIKFEYAKPEADFSLRKEHGKLICGANWWQRLSNLEQMYYIDNYMTNIIIMSVEKD